MWYDDESPVSMSMTVSLSFDQPVTILPGSAVNCAEIGLPNGSFSTEALTSADPTFHNFTVPSEEVESSSFPSMSRCQTASEWPMKRRPRISSCHGSYSSASS